MYPSGCFSMTTLNCFMARSFITRRGATITPSPEACHLYTSVVPLDSFRLKPQSPGHEPALGQLEQPLHQQRQHRRGNGPLQDQPLVQLVQSGEDHLAVAAGADEAAQRG